MKYKKPLQEHPSDMGYTWTPVPRPPRPMQDRDAFTEMIMGGSEGTVSDTTFNRLLREVGVPPMPIEAMDALNRMLGVPEEDIPKVRRQMEERTEEIMRRSGNHISWGGAKPEDLRSTEGVVLFPIPDSPLAIRAFPGDFHPRERIYCFDIYNVELGKAVKSRPGFKFMPAYCDTPVILSAEAAFGIKWKDIKEEEERFIVTDGFACRLTRPGAPPFLFQLPTLPQPAPLPASRGFAQPVPFHAQF
ncbi:hypothetical protein DFH09DRAFT_1361214 [Mycena vulgaris]|nr:hypothetical protein DFH09DRAFT_1361214 [Mycena vulgaris]